MRNIILILIALNLVGCAKESTISNSIIEIPKKPRVFKIGEKFANGIIIEFKEIKHSEPGGEPNFGLKVIGLSDFSNLNFRESLNKIQTLKDEYGEWNFNGLDFYEMGVVSYSSVNTYSTVVEDSIIKNGGKVIEKSINYWENSYYEIGKQGVQRINKTLGLRYDVYKTTDDSLNKNKLRPTRLLVYNNTPLKTFKLGQEYNYGSLIFSIDPTNRKIKIFNRVGGAGLSWVNSNQRVKEAVYDGNYGFRLPTVEEIKIIATIYPLDNIRCWTSTVDLNDPKKAFIYNRLGNPQIFSRDINEAYSASIVTSIFGVKEISY